MPFILQDGRLVEVTDAQFEAFSGGEAQLRRTTAADRRRLAAEEAAAGGQNIQTTGTNPASDQQIINPNTTNNTPGQTLTTVPAPLNQSTATDLPSIPGAPTAASGFARAAQEVQFTPQELNAAGISNIPSNAPIRSVDTPAPQTDTSGSPVPRPVDIEDPGFVPQAAPVPPQAGFGDEDDPIDPDLLTEPEPADDYTSSGDFASLQAAQAQEAEAFGRALPDDGISPYGEEDDPIDPDLVAAPEDQIDPYTAVTGSGDPVDDETTGEDVVGVTADGDLTAVSPAEFDSAQQQALLARARSQAALAAQRKQANDGDWRVKLRLAPGSDYLYRANDGNGREAGILQPLVNTDGVIFPYTPTIQTAYKANYNAYDLTHSNYRGYFYQGSAVEEINLTAVFTAQDTTEAEYLLAVIHFFRSITKMFYGKDANAGTPPPLVFLQGLGEFQFNLHPCVVSQFNYNLPNDVDYIRARSPNQANLPASLLQARQRQTVATNPFSAAWQRLQSAGVPRGGLNQTPAPPALGTNSPTYVPTKLEISLVLLPIQSRSQVSNNFSLQKYANGDLIKGGFW